MPRLGYSQTVGYSIWNGRSEIPLRRRYGSIRRLAVARAWYQLQAAYDLGQVMERADEITAGMKSLRDGGQERINRA